MSEESSARRVTVETAERRATGHAVALPDADPEAVARAVRDGSAAGVRVSCPDPGPAHEHVGVVRPGTTVRVRTALAAAARSRGLTAPEDEALSQARTDLAEVTVPDPPDVAAARRRLAGTESAVAECRERVAALRGRVQAAREADRDVSELRADLSAATRELSETETERAAAREAVERAERRARETRDARERRRRLQDRVGNLERAARERLVDEVRAEYADAMATLPGQTPADPFEADGPAAALAVGRVATLCAPVVLACDRFGSPSAAADWLDAPVVRV